MQKLLQMFTDHFSSTPCEQPYGYDPFIGVVSTIVVKVGLDKNWGIKRFCTQTPLVFTGPCHFDMLCSCGCTYRVRYCSYSLVSQLGLYLIWEAAEEGFCLQISQFSPVLLQDLLVPSESLSWGP